MKISWRIIFDGTMTHVSHLIMVCLKQDRLRAYMPSHFFYCYYSCYNKRDGFQPAKALHFVFLSAAFLDVTIFIHFISPVLIWNESQDVVHYYVQVSIEIDCFCPNGIRLLNNNVENFNVQFFFAYWASLFIFISHFSSWCFATILFVDLTIMYE